MKYLVTNGQGETYPVEAAAVKVDDERNKITFYADAEREDAVASVSGGSFVPAPDEG